MDKAELIAEMQRKPDAEILLDWIYEQVSDDIKDAIDAYLDALED